MINEKGNKGYQKQMEKIRTKIKQRKWAIFKELL